MTPPSPSANPTNAQPPVIPPVADPKPDPKATGKEPPKAEVKGEAKAEVKAEVPALPPPPPANPQAAAPAALPVIDFKDWSAYSLVLGGGYGWRDFANEQGMDHGGGYFKAGAGINLRFFNDKFKLTPRIFYEYQGLHKDLGEGISSDATVNAFGVEFDAGYMIHPYFSVHGLLGIGGAFYSSEETTDGLKGGAEFNKNAQKATLSGAGLRVQPGLALCTLGASVCFNGSYVVDTGVNPKIEVIDGGAYPPMGLNPGGFLVGGTVDALGLVNFFVGKRGKAPVKPVEKEKPATPENVKPEAPKPASPEAPKPAKLTGIAFEEAEAKKVTAFTEQAKTNATVAKTDADEFKKEKDEAKQKGLASDSMFQFREALRSVNAIDQSLVGMELEIASMSGDDKKKAEAILKDAKKQREAANNSARAAWDSASATAKAYNKGKDAAAQLDFPDTKPDATKPTAAPGQAQNPNPVPQNPNPPPQNPPTNPQPQNPNPKPGTGIIFDDQ